MKIFIEGESTPDDQSYILGSGNIYFRGDDRAIDPTKPETLYVFDWTEQADKSDIPLGQLVRLSTSYRKDGIFERIDHRVVILNSETHSEKPPIVYLPDYFGTPVMNEIAPYAATGRKVIALSYPENFSSSVTLSSIDNWTRARDYLPFYKAVLAQVGIDNFDAVGLSQGASILAALATEPDMQDKIGKMVMHNPGGVFTQPGYKIPLGILDEPHWWRTDYAKYIEAKRKIMEPIYPPPLEVERGSYQNRKILGQPQPSDARRGIHIATSESLIKELKGPKVLVLASDKDKLFPPGKLKKAIVENNNFELRVIGNQGHSGIKGNELIGDYILAWLDEELSSPTSPAR
jgi:pimeloyl-ACP methyl ester carboxylesterase